MKNFKALNIIDSTMSFTDQRVIIAELVEIHFFGGVLSTGQRTYRYGTEGQFYIIDYNSSLAQYVISSAQSEDILELDLDDFVMIPENKRGRQVQSYYHNSVSLHFSR